MSDKNITVFETTLDKVLSIITKIKDFIINNTQNYSNVIDELDWVRKVITNKTLYTYEVNKDKLADDNQKFLDFVIKYNEEVINLNKKHALVRDILSMKKNKEFLQKPSLLLKKLSSNELNLLTYNASNYKTKKSVANPLGRWVLNLYFKKQEENKILFKNNSSSRNIKNNNIENVTNEKKNLYIKSTSGNKIKKNKNNTMQLSSSLTSHNNNYNQKTIASPSKLTKVKTNLNRNKNLKYSSYLKNKNTKINITSVKKTMEIYFINEMEKKRKQFIDINKNKINLIEESKNNNITNNNINDHIILNKVDPKYLTTLIEKHFEYMRTITDEKFNIFKLKKLVGYQNVLPLMCHFMFKILGLIDSRIIVVKKLIPFLTTVSQNYLETTLYHNSLHGADVCHSLFIYILNSNLEEICETTVLDILGLVVSATGHDLKHPGYNNNYHINSSSELALRYNDISCLENYHASTLFRILRKDDNNIFENMDISDYKQIRKRIVNQILATDMVNHAMVLSSVKAKISSLKSDNNNNSKENKKFIFLSGVEKSKFDEQQIMFNYLIHTADLGHNAKKFEISLQWVELLTYEFWKQGDSEREKNLTISFLCDRNNVDIPSSQVGFLRAFILSTFDILITMFPKLDFTVDNAKNNIKEWQALADKKRRTGWTPDKKNKKEDEKNN